MEDGGGLGRGGGGRSGGRGGGGGSGWGRRLFWWWLPFVEDFLGVGGDQVVLFGGGEDFDGDVILTGEKETFAFVGGEEEAFFPF